MMKAVKRKLAAPVANVETQPYWDAASKGKLMLKRCVDCGKPHFYPRALCPFCFGETEWIESKGEGEIYSLSVMLRAEIPYAIAFVTLDEGPTMMSNIVDCDFDNLRIGQRVKVTFEPAENGQAVPMFSPVP
jgi:uncharacterized protein